MIALVRGTVAHIGLDHAVIDCQGVGFKVLATPTTLGTLSRGSEASLLTHLAVKDDALTLYGFSSAEDRDIFLILQLVSGLGPKLALAALSVSSAGQLAQQISSGDTKGLQAIPGVGKKMAERMALELRDKVTPFVPAAAGTQLPDSPVISGAGAHTAEQVVEALVGLGFSEKQSRPVVEAVVADNPQLATAAVLRAALSTLGRN